MPKLKPRLNGETLELLRSGLRIVALRSLGDPEAAEEAAQEALVRGLEALKEDRLKDTEKLGAYFRGIVRHVIADTIKDGKRTVSLDHLPEYPDRDPSANPLQTLISMERKEAVARVMAELSPQARQCLDLCFFQGLPPREVAVRLGEPAPRIRKRRSRALQKVREILRDGTGTGGGHEMGPGDTERSGDKAPSEAPRPRSGV